MPRTSLEETWMREWPAALAAWSRFVKLSPPRFLSTPRELEREGMGGSFAAIRLHDHAIMIDVAYAQRDNLQAFGREILAHEIGHHVYAPGDVHDNARLLARIRRGLPTQEAAAPMVANLYTDLLINDRLQRQANINLLGVWQHLNAQPSSTCAPPTRLWTLYMRIYEVAWSLPRGSLARGNVTQGIDIDADLGARLLRSYASQWMRGAGRFAMLCLPYLIEDEEEAKQNARIIWQDTKDAGRGGAPDGLVEIDPEEIAGAIHPAEDAELSGVAKRAKTKAASTCEGESAPQDVDKNAPASGQAREPFEYGEILKASGLELSEHDIAVRYYRERARPHLIKFPTKRAPVSSEPLVEGVGPWESGEPLEDIDWLHSLIQSPRVVPGVTTVQRLFGDQPSREEKPEPIDLDLYVDCSGSMPNPQQQTSFTALAGAIIVLSALRAGSRVQATLWSGAQQFETNGHFSRDETEVMRILTGFIGGATAFPIHILRDTFAMRKESDRAAHILILSDDGVTTLFNKDERGASGWDISRMALSKARGGGTMALNLWLDVAQNADLVRAQEQGWSVHKVSAWDDLVSFARDFARRHYEI
jgi:hypothetical protein